MKSYNYEAQRFYFTHLGNETPSKLSVWPFEQAIVLLRGVHFCNEPFATSVRDTGLINITEAH
jgi:hypothetical protein